MNWILIRHQADLLNEAERQQALWSLSDHRGLPALVALIDELRRSALGVGSDLTHADHPGTLAHCAGAISALDELEARLQAAIVTPPESPAA